MYELNASEYEAIGAPAEVVKWIREGAKLPFSQEPSACFNENRVYTTQHSRFIESEINRLLTLGAIKQVDFQPKCILAMRAIPKKSGAHRLVVDCRPINVNMVVPKFHQEGIKVVSELIQTDDILMTIDVKDGFHHIPLHDESQTYVGMAWKGKFYVWKVLCFGIAIAPYLFHKVVRPMVQYLRQQHLRLAPFVDDFLLMMKRALVHRHKCLVLSTMRRLGWRPNLKKCDFSVNTHAVFVGFDIQSDTSRGPWIKVLPAKIRKLRRAIHQVLQLTFVSARALARIAGQCIAMTKAIMPGKLLLRNIYRVIASRRSWEDNRLYLTNAAINDLNWWLAALKGWNGAPMTTQIVDTQIETDASGFGWGSYMKIEENNCVSEKLAAGLWNKKVSFKHSNYKELLAVLQALRSFAPILKHRKHVQILSDNITTVAYVNHLGGPSQELSDLMTTIWTTAATLGIELSAKYLCGKMNYRADGLSRLESTHEWELHPSLFQQIDSMWGPHTVDRFAATHNAQIPVFNSRFWDPNSAAVDALAQSWRQENNFVNPPFCLIPRILDLIQEQQVEATIIAPLWPAQPWYQRLLTMCVTAPLQLPNNQRTFRRIKAIPEPWKNSKWLVYAWRVSGRKSLRNKGGQLNLPGGSSPYGHQQR